MRYGSHFASSRRFNYALRTSTGGGHSIYYVDYVVNKDSLYIITQHYDIQTGDYTIKYIFDSYTPNRVVSGYDYSLGKYLVLYDYDSASAYNVQNIGDYNR